MSSMEDKERKFFRELFMCIVLGLMIISAWLWDSGINFEKLLEKYNEQAIRHEAH